MGDGENVNISSINVWFISTSKAYNLFTWFNREFWFKSYSIKAWAAANFARDSSTCYNPFIYAWINKNFRQDIYHLFYSCFLSCFNRCLPKLSRSNKTNLLPRSNNKKKIHVPIIRMTQPSVNEDFAVLKADEDSGVHVLDESD
ncbi:LOW QUALITY PROTEIN: hypothetical protein Smp_153420 [Schistosoma mansoni]|uniref:hypothetical protein n=1 Tax=Schistosoma mansoni TaxID=6183 RepID=UPI00022DC78A|nr:LOW QUALITY PROTEIN: hypothetical protein Smp_153420 [Schistosoma mansoni]|eukprot:XP_018652646.1 LOW QUALITY PROTEIN: hypothetical protein Smp_153420 [Schistosoma mansoni]